MRRRFLGMASGVVLGSVVLPLRTWAQTKPRRIAYVYIFKEGPSRPLEKEFRGRLAELGWIDGRNAEILVRDADNSNERLDAIMRELVESRVDVIVAACTPEAKSAAKFTTTIPIVMAATGDPVAAGLVPSLARPGGNITGVSAMLLEQSAKRMSILKEAFPGITRATVLWNPGRPDNRPEVAAMTTAAQGLGVTLDSVEVRTPVELKDALDVLPASKTQAILNAGDSMLGGNRDKLIAYAERQRVPGLYEERLYTEQGGLMSYGPNFVTLHRRAADYVDKILKGAKPGELPIEQPTTFELVINAKTAKDLGFTIPQSLRARADII